MSKESYIVIAMIIIIFFAAYFYGIVTGVVHANTTVTSVMAMENNE